MPTTVEEAEAFISAADLDCIHGLEQAVTRFEMDTTGPRLLFLCASECQESVYDHEDAEAFAEAGYDLSLKAMALASMAHTAVGLMEAKDLLGADRYGQLLESRKHAILAQSIPPAEPSRAELEQRLAGLEARLKILQGVVSERETGSL